MIRAEAEIWDNDPNGDGPAEADTVEFDAEPWFNQARPSELAYLSKYGFQDCGYAEDCLRWTIENYPTPDLLHFKHVWDNSSQQVNVTIDAERARKWIRLGRRMNKVARMAVDRLMGESNEDELLHDVAHSALPDYKVEQAFDQAYASGRNTLSCWQEALKALGYHPKFVAEMGSLIASYVSFAWAHNSALASEHVKDKLTRAMLPAPHVAALLRLFSREINSRKSESTDDLLPDVTAAALKPRIYYAYLTTQDGLRTVWMDIYGDPSDKPVPFTFHQMNSRMNNGHWRYVKWMPASDLKEGQEYLPEFNYLLGCRQCKANFFFAQSGLMHYKCPDCGSADLVHGPELRTMDTHPSVVLSAPKPRKPYKRRAPKPPPPKKDETPTPQVPPPPKKDEIQWPKEWSPEVIAALKKAAGIKESDDILRDVAMAGATVPWVTAKHAWDSEVRYGSGENPFRTVLYALGYKDEVALDVADNISFLMASASDPGRDGGPEEFDEEWEAAWRDVEAELSRLDMPPSHVDAIKRIWRTQGPNTDLWESDEQPPQEQPQEFNDDEMLQSVAAAGINPAHALVDAIKHGTSMVKTQPASGSYTWELTVEVKRPDSIGSMPNMPRMVIVKARQYIDDQPDWSSLRKKIGGYFWVHPTKADSLLEPLTRLFKSAKKATLWMGEMEGAYNDVIAYRHSPPPKKTKTGRNKKSIYNSGVYKYYG